MSVGSRLGEGGGRRGLVGRGLVGRGLVGSGGGTSDASEAFLKDFVLVLLVKRSSIGFKNVPLRLPQALHAEEFPQALRCWRSAITLLPNH